ncbi:MAG: dephospho-CoA kinase [Bacteroidetes bacterium]|nr:dephospho-CoA kinase [Bacteroidota bacterium]
MSLRIALTGGIGSGKSTVANMFGKLGVPIYQADSRAATLQNKEPLRTAISKLLGDEVYDHGTLQRNKVASLVFDNPGLLRELNQLVHPAVASDYEQWRRKQTAPYTIKEAAIIFETGTQDAYDKVILVIAPLDDRIARVVQRDGMTAPDVNKRISHQWPDERKMKLADYVIENITLEETEIQVARLHRNLLGLTARS